MSTKLNESEKIAVEKLKEKVKDCKLNDSSDEFLVQWLSANKFDVVQTDKMLRQTLEWRRTHNVDNILETYKPPEIVIKNVSLHHVGKDKFNCPVWFCNHGRNDMKGVVQSHTRKECTQYIMWTAENMMRKIRIANEQKPEGAEKINSVFFFIDIEGLPMKQLTCKAGVEVLLELFQTLDTHYPNIFRRIFVINSNRIFTMLLAAILPFISASTADKCDIHGSDKKEWEAALLQEIDADQLPVFYGGTMIDPNGDPRCPSKFVLGQDIPREYYLSNNKPVPKGDMESITVNGGSKKKIQLDVSQVKSILRWEFMSEGGDIAFRVSFKGTDNDVVDLMPLERIESHLVMEEGQVLLEAVGICTIEFNNAFSFLKSKKVYYNISILPPSK